MGPIQTTSLSRRRALVAVLAIWLLLAGASTAHADSLTLMWDPSPDSTVVGYVVYVGTQSGTYTRTHDVGNAVWFTLDNAVPGQRYYFAVAAYAQGSLLGPHTDEVSAYSNAPPTLVNPGNQTELAGAYAAVQLQGSDPYGEPITYSATGLPPGLVLTSSTGLISGTPTTAGTYQVNATVSDGVLSAHQAFTWTIQADASADTQAPTLRLTAPEGSSPFTVTATPFILSGIANDDRSVAQVLWSNSRGGSGVASGTSSWTAVVPLQGGDNVITITARDAAGNEGRLTATVTYREIDTEAPTIAVTSPFSGAAFTTSATRLTLSGTARDNVGVASVSWSDASGASGLAAGTTSWSIADLALRLGTNHVLLTAEDTAGNQQSLLIVITVVDETPPVVTVTAPNSAGTYVSTDATISLAGYSSDDVVVADVSWTSDRGGGGPANGVTNWMVPSVLLQRGRNILTVTARDGSGNVASAIVTVDYEPDVTAPSIVIETPTSNKRYNTSGDQVRVAGRASDNMSVSHVTWATDWGAAGTASGTSQWAVDVPLRPGLNVIRVTAHDAAGNASAAELTVSAKVKGNGPR